MTQKEMPISAHLVELRTRLILCMVGALLGMIVAYLFYPDVFYPMIRAPLDALQGRGSTNPFVIKTPLLEMLMKQGGAEAADGATARPPVELHYFGLPVPLVMRLKVSLVIGLLLASPLLVFQIWAFVSSGLYPHERRYVLLCGPLSFVLFLAGAALAYFFVLPLGVVFLMGQGDLVGMTATLTVDEYTSFVMWLLLAFGVVFQMPLVALFLTKIGVIGPETLRRQRRYAILLIFIIAAVLTPPDPFTQIAMAIPMLLLYEFSILLAWMARKKRVARPEAD